MGYRVRALDDLSTGKQKNIDMFLENPRYEFIKGDIKDLDTCMKACEAVDYVLNQEHGVSSSFHRDATVLLSQQYSGYSQYA